MALFEVSQLSKSFGGIAALSDVSFQIEEAESVGLVGPNGAGKTTLFDCVAGLHHPDEGAVFFAGRRIDSLPMYRRARLGIGRTFQRLELFTGMTPREHLLVTGRTRAGTGRLWRDLVGLGRPSRAEQAAASGLLELVGLAEVADRPVEALSLGRGRLVELARALAGAPRLLMLDEPSSGLDESERALLVAALERARRERPTALLLVEHDLALASQIVERLVVLQSGRVVADGPFGEVLAEPAVRRAYLGAAP